jgi:hypothetical protein
MPIESHDIPPVLRLYLRITQYPILAPTIRSRMRQELFRRGIISPARLEQEAREKAVLSQQREGILNPYVEEPADVWERRLSQVRDDLTDFYFAHNLPPDRFEEIVTKVLAERQSKPEVLAYNPELAPWDVLIRQAEEYEALPAEELARARHHLQETKVVLIKQMISDQLAFVRVAKEYLTTRDLKWIYSRRIGGGKIGGKAAGLVLAWKILEQTFAARPKGRTPPRIVIPESYFIGTDVFYEFLALNDLTYFINQKYKYIDQIESEYPELREAYLAGRFPDYVNAQLRNLLIETAGQPLIVRSSSLLEDNFESSFAGKYESVFCPNQGTAEENFADLTRAIATVYASVASPNALLYRKQIGLLDYDERMAILIQVVQGERYRDCFFPAAAGMAYSRNPFIWNPKLRREDGFMRMVAGLGTRAVERVGEDYPRMVALSHPQLRPESGAQEIRYYSQYFVDVINLAENRFETRRISELVAGDYPGLRFLASLDKGDYVGPMIFNDPALDPRTLVVTFDGLLSQTAFVDQMKAILKALEFGYGRPVDIEFTVALGNEYPRPSVELHLLQCRPHSGNEGAEEVRFPDPLPEADVIFGTVKLVPTGRVRDVRYVVYVDPEKYDQIQDPSLKLQLARVIGHVNQRLEGQRFILMGPGRWGSSNLDLGLKVGYADIYNTRALVEIGLAHGNSRPTLSYGTHFFQDLVEAHIYPLAIYPGEPDNPFRESFFRQALNALPTLLPDDAGYAEYVKVIDVPATTGGRVLELVMSGEQGRAVAFLTRAEK